VTRRVVWFSCGAASAVAAKLTIEKHGVEGVHVVYCDTSTNEHPDNKRFMRDVERWLGTTITIIASTKYTSIEDVFEKRKYMAGIRGAVCTTELKKIPRFDFETPDDIHIFGFTAEEKKRIVRFVESNPGMQLEWPLYEELYSKERCFERLRAAGIELPAMYLLGYRNNNCMGCVKATSPAYWNKIRKDFPDVFANRAEQSRRLGVKLTRVKGVRMFLDELPADVGHDERQENISCGPECGQTGKR
jgi:hypothetical protein